MQRQNFSFILAKIYVRGINYAPLQCTCKIKRISFLTELSPIQPSGPIFLEHTKGHMRRNVTAQQGCESRTSRTVQSSRKKITLSIDWTRDCIQTCRRLVGESKSRVAGAEGWCLMTWDFGRLPTPVDWWLLSGDRWQVTGDRRVVTGEQWGSWSPVMLTSGDFRRSKSRML